MSETAHKGQILPLVNQMIPIEKTTTFHASYDYGLHGFNQGQIIHPVGHEHAYFFNRNGLKLKNPLAHQANLAQEWTVEAWVRLDSNTPDNAFLIDGFNSGLWLTNSSGQTLLYLNGGVNDYYDYASANLRDGKWHHIAFVFRNSDGTRNTYMDGISVGRGTGPNKTSTPSGISDVITIGHSVVGCMSEFRIWDRAKSGQEIKTDMNIRMSGSEKNLVTLLRMTEREGPVAFNAVPNAEDVIWSNQLSSVNGPVAAMLQKNQGKFGGAVLIEPGTVNLAPYSDYSNHTYGVSENVGGWGGDLARVMYSPSGGYNDLPYMKMTKYAGGDGGSYRDEHDYIKIVEGKVYTISCWMKASQAMTLNSYAMCINRQADNVYRNPPYNVALTTEWQRFSWKYTPAAGHAGDYVHRGIVYSDENMPFDVYWSGFQVEERDSPSSYVNGVREEGRLWYPKELVTPAAFTVSCWFNIPYMHRVTLNNAGVSGSWYHPIIEIAGDTIAKGQSFAIVAGPEPASFLRKIRLYAPAGGTGELAIQDNTWYHMTTTYDGLTYKVYIDGVERISYAAGPISPKEGQYLMVGGGYIGKSNIMIDELRIESRAISPEEVAAWAASGLHYNYLDYSTYVD